MSDEIDDKTYEEASVAGFAHAVVLFYRELVKGGLGHQDALLVTIEWMRIVTQRGRE